MIKLFTLMALVGICTATKAQETSPDTIRVGNIIITRNGKKDNNDNSGSKNNDPRVMVDRHFHKKLANISTNWGILDLGFSNYSDKTDYSNTGGYLYNRPGVAPLNKNDFKLRTGKSINVNIWFFMQRLNLVKQHVSLKYGLGLELNNYRYNIGTNISYLQHNPFITGQVTSPVIFRDSIQFTKNKLAADYLTVPLMLNFSSSPGFTNRGISLSAGVSAGYLYSERNKQKSHERGKLKNGGDYDLERFKLSYVAELGIGPVRFYGSYSPKSFYNTGLDMRPYTVGIRFSNW